MTSLRIAAVAAAALTGVAVSASAGDQDSPDQNCDGSTYEMVECLKARTAQWDKRLNAAYKSAFDAAQPKQREQLRRYFLLTASNISFATASGVVLPFDACAFAFRMASTSMAPMSGVSAAISF